MPLTGHGAVTETEHIAADVVEDILGMARFVLVSILFSYSFTEFCRKEIMSMTFQTTTTV